VITTYITPWRRVLLEKLIVAQQVKKFPTFMEPKHTSPIHNSLLLYPILSQLNPVHTFTPYFFKIYINIFLTSMPRSPTWV
jgi:hypothetical protein